MALSQFDVEDALSRLADPGLPILPHHIPELIESEVPEHDDEGEVPLVHPNLPPVTSGSEDDEDLDTALRAFQEEDRRTFGRRLTGFNLCGDFELDPTDYTPDSDQDYSDQDDEDDEDDASIMDLDDSENERMVRDSLPARLPVQLQTQNFGEVQATCVRSSRSAKPLEAFIQGHHEKDEQVQDSEIVLSRAGNVEPVSQNEILSADAEEVLMWTVNQPASPVSPPIEDKFTEELSTQIDPSLAEAIVVAPSPLPSSQLPSTSEVTRFSESSMDPVTGLAGVDIVAVKEEPKKAGAAEESNILEEESVRFHPSAV